jgi:hypothetical protein
LPAVEQCKDRFVQQPRDPHDEFGLQALAALLAPKPRQIEIQRAHFDVGEHVDGVFEPRRRPHRAIGRPQPAALRGGDLHGAACRVYQLRLAVHMGVEPDPLAIAARDQMNAVAGRGMVRLDGRDWRFGDTHWPHPVRTRLYNLMQKT